MFKLKVNKSIIKRFCVLETRNSPTLKKILVCSSLLLLFQFFINWHNNYQSLYCSAYSNICVQVLVPNYYIANSAIFALQDFIYNSKFPLSSHQVGILNQDYIIHLHVPSLCMPFGLNHQIRKNLLCPLLPELVDDFLSEIKPLFCICRLTEWSLRWLVVTMTQQ